MENDTPDLGEVLDTLQSIDRHLNTIAHNVGVQRFQQEREIERQRWEEQQKKPCICTESQARLIESVEAEGKANPLTPLTGLQGEVVVVCERHGSQTFRHIIMPTMQLPADHTRMFGPYPMTYERNPFK